MCPRHHCHCWGCNVIVGGILVAIIYVAVDNVVNIITIVMKLSFLMYLPSSFPPLVPIIVDGIVTVIISAVVTVVVVAVIGSGRDILAVNAIVCIVIVIIH